MDLVNRTPLPAGLLVTEVEEDAPRLGIVVAKATYAFDTDGNLTVDNQEPLDVLDKDEETDLGLLPRDDLPREDDHVFEVMLLGKAHAPAGGQALRMTVRLQVGTERRELAVWGDRTWQGSDKSARIGDPQPFTEMPLTWERAFGGSCEVEIDQDAFVTVSDPRNDVGCGFEPGERAKQMGKFLQSPRGFPRGPAERPLANLEDPAQPVATWQDAPAPLCWATVPMTSWLHVSRGIGEPAPDGAPSLELTPGIHHRAHPTWVIGRPEAGAEVSLEGLRPEGPVAFRLPLLRVLADFTVGATTGTDELAPHSLLLLPEEQRFVLTYRRVFAYPFTGGDERSIRLRTAEGWCGNDAVQEVVP